MDRVELRSGELRHRITIQEMKAAEDVSGATEEWVEFGKRWAKIEALRGTDTWRQGQTTSEKFTTITIRYEKGIRANMRIVCGDEIYTVLDPIDVKKKHVRLDILCVELDGK